MADAVLDTLIEAETPEGIVLALRPAGLPVRLYAFLLDWLIRLVVIYAAALLSVFMGGIGAAFWIILLFVMEWFYPIAFELGRNGATPGKSILGLKVVMDNGLPVTPAASLMRNLLRTADFLPVVYVAGVLTMLLRRDFKRLGDIAAATLVVHRPRVALPTTLHNVESIAPVMTLALRDQAALMALATRAPRLTSERLDELAGLAAAASGDAGKSGPAVTRRVLGVAQWLTGRRS